MLPFIQYDRIDIPKKVLEVLGACPGELWLARAAHAREVRREHGGDAAKDRGRHTRLLAREYGRETGGERTKEDLEADGHIDPEGGLGGCMLSNKLTMSSVKIIFNLPLILHRSRSEVA
jgi:hypothetical protein